MAALVFIDVASTCQHTEWLIPIKALIGNDVAFAYRVVTVYFYPVIGDSMCRARCYVVDHLGHPR